MSCIFKRIFDFFSPRDKLCEDVKNEELKNILFNYKPTNFVPHAYYNKDMNSIEVLLKGSSYYVLPLTKSLDAYISQETNEIVGVRVYNATHLISQIQ